LDPVVVFSSLAHATGASKFSEPCSGDTTMDGKTIQSGKIGHNGKKYPDGSTVTVNECRFVDPTGTDM